MGSTAAVVCVHVCRHLYLCLRADIHVCAHTHMCVCPHACRFRNLCVCVHICSPIYMCACMFKHGHVCSGLFSTIPVVLLETNHSQYCFLIVLMFLFLFSFLVTWKKCWIWVWSERMHLTWWWSAIAARSRCSTDWPWSVRSWQDTQIPLWQSAPVPRKTSLSLHLRCVGLKQNCIVVMWFLF